MRVRRSEETPGTRRRLVADYRDSFPCFRDPGLGQSLLPQAFSRRPSPPRRVKRVGSSAPFAMTAGAGRRPSRTPQRAVVRSRPSPRLRKSHHVVAGRVVSSRRMGFAEWLRTRRHGALGTRCRVPLGASTFNPARRRPRRPAASTACPTVGPAGFHAMDVDDLPRRGHRRGGPPYADRSSADKPIPRASQPRPRAAYGTGGAGALPIRAGWAS